MKKSILFVLCIIVSSTISAQFRFGVVAGGNISEIQMEDGLGNNNGIYKSRIGFQIGPAVEYMFSDYVGLQIQAIYSQNGSNLNADKFQDFFEESEPDKKITFSGHSVLNQIQLPLYLKFCYPLENEMRIYGMIGGFFAHSFEGKLTLKGKYNNMTESAEWSLFDTSIFDGNSTQINPYLMNKWSGGIAAEIGLEVTKNIRASVGYKRILSDMSGYSIAGHRLTTKMNTFTLSCGYFF